MRSLSPRPSRLSWFAPLLLLLVAGNFSCEDKHIGRVCDLQIDAGVTGSGSSSNAVLNTALECPSRICLLPANARGVNTTSLCTADCSSDDDCSDAETRDKSSSSDLRCQEGFTCTVAATVGDFCCRKLCVCRDFLNIPATGGIVPPAVCASTPANKAQCQNIQ